jgi:hypothetical protein
MKLTTLVPIIIACACAAAAIYLGSELAHTRDQVAQLEQARAADAARIRELEQDRLQAAAAPPLATRNFTAASADPAPRSDPPPPAEPVKPAGTSAPPRSRRDVIDETPEGQNMRRLQSEVRLRRMYAAMPALLGLNANQADKLFNLLADSQVTMREQIRDNDSPDNRRAIQDAARAQRDAAIEGLLGAGKAAEFQSFEKSLPARMQVNRIGESMAAANVPLSDAQRDALIAAVMLERDATPPPERPDGSGPDDSNYQARYLDWQADFSSRVQARVEPLLSADQAAQYRQAITVQNARRAEARARAERGRQSATL